MSEFGEGCGIFLRRDMAAAKVLGIPITKGWRKVLATHQMTEEQAALTKSYVHGRNAITTRSKMNRSTNGCLFKLHAEHEIAGELYFQLRQAGINAKMEVCVVSHFHKSGFMRIDIGIIKNDSLVAAIECKQAGKKLSGTSVQAKAYKHLRDSFGVHIEFVNYHETIGEVVQRMKAL